jgi:hypothetical protein
VALRGVEGLPGVVDSGEKDAIVEFPDIGLRHVYVIPELTKHLMVKEE